MQKFGIIFLQFFVIILLLACSSLDLTKSLDENVNYDINWVDANKVTIAWDPVTFDPNKHKGSEIRYLVYINYSDRHEEMLVGKYVDGVWVDEETPIAETSCTIELKTPGDFFIGVQSVTCDVRNENIEILQHSAIAWSDNKIYTHNNPFGVRSRR